MEQKLIKKYGWHFAPYRFFLCTVFSNIEPLYWYLQTLISLCVFPSTRWFFRQNNRISRIVLCGNAISEVSATTTSMGKTKRENQENKNSEHATHLLAGFFSGISWLALPNLIEVAMQLLRLLFRCWLFIVFISRNTSSHLLLV